MHWNALIISRILFISPTKSFWHVYKSNQIEVKVCDMTSTIMCLEAFSAASMHAVHLVLSECKPGLRHCVL